ncbi:fumarylacetoacetate hydrolase family protein [Streptomyces bobili]|uniref:fumarylacetoacetate hydrolase family protein n=1 Tax=Streptomyces bobili TaxID=67280 RepID=UPI0033A173C0
MRYINYAGRAALAVADGYVDLERASRGRFPSEPMAVYARWTEFTTWAGAWLDAPDASLVQPLVSERIGPPVPMPNQILAVGVNYRGHAEEAGIALPAEPMVFTKFPSAITGPFSTVSLPPGSVDFEAELVVVIGTGGRHINAATAWNHVAGLTVGQDLSERETQLRPPAPNQFSLGKSFAGFAPIGPYLVTIDEFANPNDLQIGCSLNGQEMQKARTGDFVFSVPELLESLSTVVELRPGDLVFTGTPAGVGWTRDPKQLISPGDELTTYIEGIGLMRHTFTAGTTTASERKAAGK